MSIKSVSAAITDRGLSEKRPENEDSFLEIPGCGIYAVADGVGGAHAGEVASQMAVEILGEAFANRSESQDPESVMRAAIEKANSAIYQMAQELPQLANMATTIVAMHIAANIATIGHVGDSRLYRVDRDGNLFADTDDHSIVAEEVRAGRMTREQADNHPSRNIISRALGAEPEVEPDLKTIMVEPGSAFLLCSDGVTRHVSDDEIRGVLNFGGEPSEVCQYLRNLCFERGAEDNLTAVVVKLPVPKGEQPIVPVFEPVGYEEEATVASTRPPADLDDDDDNGDLLELELLEADTAPFSFEEPAEPIIEEDVNTLEIEPAIREKAIETSQTRQPAEPFSMFGADESHVEDHPVRSNDTANRLLTSLGMLVVGSLVGLGVYHFVLAPQPQTPAGQSLSVMQTDDIALSSFEKLRRTVDADPAAYVREVRPTDTPEDNYLIGRAYLLSGDPGRARQALIEAQKQLSNAAPANARVLHADIATALVLVNDPFLPPRLKQEIDASLRSLSNSAPAEPPR